MANNADHPADPPPCASPPPAGAILLDARAYIGDNPNTTTAEAMTSTKNKRIRVSISPDHPPAPSRLFVHCPNHGRDVFDEDPRVICAARGRRSPPPPPPPRPRLRPIRPLTRQGRLLHLPDRSTSVAALSVSFQGHVLHLFNSESWAWTIHKNLTVTKPLHQRPFPTEMHSVAADRLYEHITTTVITLGGKDGGTMGWADLWSGVLLCDVLDPEPTLRHIPLPLPRSFLERGKKIEGCPKSHRGIAVVQNGLKFLEVDVYGERLPSRDPETGHFTFRVDDWELTEYTNTSVSGAWEDWKEGRTVKASSIGVDQTIRRQLVQCGLLDETPGGMELQNLHAYQPALRLDDKGAVYLLAKTKFMHKKASILSVDIEGNKVQAVAEFGIDRSLGLSLAFRPSRIFCHVHV